MEMDVTLQCFINPDQIFLYHIIYHGAEPVWLVFLRGSEVLLLSSLLL